MSRILRDPDLVGLEVWNSGLVSEMRKKLSRHGFLLFHKEFGEVEFLRASPEALNLIQGWDYP